MDFESSYPNIYDCSQCPFERCDWVSKRVYNFGNDVTFSERHEQSIIDAINKSWKFKASKCDLEWYPDIEIRDLFDNVVSYLEVKAQQRTFMSVQKILPDSDLVPSETVALNLSDLLRYFEIKDKVEVPVYLIWVLENRECIVGDIRWGIKYYMQSTYLLKKIYEYYWDKRRFRRESWKWDVVNGQHKWVVVNYHFSLNELIEVDVKSENFLKILIP